MKVIEVKNVRKEYHLGSVAKDSIVDTVKMLFNRKSKAKEESFWALKDISFDLYEGEVLGIIGKNGAGKSTLLKVLSRITEPTSGEIKIKGRVASLLEVGTGFHPELSGRENVFLNGSILGMQRKEIKATFDQIVNFAGVEKFIDTPVKHYSSGMYVRLAFSVAAHLEPEILIIDEVLAVGDAEFQKKCLGKMKAVAGEGRTVLFVSHNMDTVSKLCTRAIMLEKGKVVYEGNTADCIDYYRENKKLDLTEQKWIEIEAPGNDKVKVISISLSTDEADRNVKRFYIDSTIRLSFEVRCYIESLDLGATIVVKNSRDLIVFTDGVVLSKGKSSKIGTYLVEVEIPPKLLNADFYSIDLTIGESRKYILTKVEEIIIFEVLQGENLKHEKKLPGIIYRELNWTVNHKID